MGNSTAIVTGIPAPSKGDVWDAVSTKEYSVITLSVVEHVPLYMQHSEDVILEKMRREAARKATEDNLILGQPTLLITPCEDARFGTTITMRWNAVKDVDYAHTALVHSSLITNPSRTVIQAFEEYGTGRYFEV